MNFLPLVLEAEEVAKSSLFSADQVGGYAVTALITLINVAVAYIIIKKVIFKPIKNIITKRQEAIAASVDEAEKSKIEAAKNAEESKKAIDDARTQASQIIEDARKDASEMQAVAKKKAEDEASEILSRAQTEANRMKKVAIEEMKDEISDLAVAIAGRVIGDVVEHDKLKDLANKHTAAIIEEEVDKLEQ